MGVNGGRSGRVEPPIEEMSGEEPVLLDEAFEAADGAVARVQAHFGEAGEYAGGVEGARAALLDEHVVALGEDGVRDAGSRGEEGGDVSRPLGGLQARVEGLVVFVEVRLGLLKEKTVLV